MRDLPTEGVQHGEELVEFSDCDRSLPTTWGEEEQGGACLSSRGAAMDTDICCSGREKDLDKRTWKLRVFGPHGFCACNMLISGCVGCWHQVRCRRHPGDPSQAQRMVVHFTATTALSDTGKSTATKLCN